MSKEQSTQLEEIHSRVAAAEGLLPAIIELTGSVGKPVSWEVASEIGRLAWAAQLLLKSAEESIESLQSEVLRKKREAA